MSFIDDIGRVNTTYYRSDSPAELSGGLKALGALLDGGELTKENAENAEALYCRLYLKLRLTQFFKSFDKDIIDELEAYLQTEYPAAEKKGYKKTCTVMAETQRLIKLIKPLSELICGAQSALNSDAELTPSVLAKLQKAKERAGELFSPFGAEIKFLDACAETRARLEKIIAGAREKRASSLEEKVKRVLKEVSGKYLLYEYFPLPDRDGSGAETSVICTPFIDEARLYAVRASEGKKLFELDATSLESLAEIFSDDIYEYIIQKKCAVLITRSAKLSERKRLRLFKNAMLAGKSGASSFILDENGDGKEYSECMSCAVEDERLTPSDAGKSYITMPAFSDVCAELETKGIIKGAEEYGALKNMPFMGFIGLNKLVSSFVAGENWKFTGERASRENETLAFKYLSVLSASHLFIDSGWGDYPAGGKRVISDGSGCDLSEVPAEDTEAVTKIFSCGYSAFAKCGMIAGYFAEKSALSRGELESNVKLAVRLIFQLMRLETVPDAEVRDMLDNPTAGGLCCGGDKLILFRYADCTNSNWLKGSLVHECFHAMQFKLRKGGWSEWYFDNFGITRGRAERWSLTNNIYDGNTGSDMYKVHIIEADAKAFEADCAEACADVWDKVFTNFSA